MPLKTLVVGLGNPILTDDGVGVKVAYAVANTLPGHLREHITIQEASVGGLRLMEMMIGYQNAIVIDAYRPYGQKIIPGTIHRLSLEDLKRISPTQHSASAHDTTLVTAIDAGRKLGFELPRNIVIFAVEVENIRVFNEQGTEAVERTIPELAAMVLTEINRIEESQLAVPV